MVVKPSNRPENGINGMVVKPSNRPEKGMNGMVVKPSNRPGIPPQQQVMSMKLKPGSSGGNGLGRLDGPTATQLNNAKNVVGPKTKTALDDAANGKLLSKADISFLKGALEFNKKLTPAEKGAIIAALQNDAKQKGLRQNHNGGGGNGGDPSGGCSGGGGGGDPSGGCSGGGGMPSGGDPSGGGPGGGGGAPVGSDPVVSPENGGGEPPAQGGEGNAPADDGGVRLTAVDAGGPADQAGLRAGDVLLSVGGVRTRTFADLRNALTQAQGDVEVIFINGENGQTESLTVTPEGTLIGVTCE
jgi:hypothetical protein